MTKISERVLQLLLLLRVMETNHSRLYSSPDINKTAACRVFDISLDFQIQVRMIDKLDFLANSSIPRHLLDHFARLSLDIELVNLVADRL